MVNDDDAHKLFYEREYAGNLVGLQKIPGATGVSWGEALAMITSRPAEAIGLGGQIGRLSPGEHADVVVWSGDPLEVTSEAEQVFIDGVQQPMEDHQSRLLERYRYLQRSNLPKAYRP
jgi:cytosine/adenosine deaminase-related metal-dependent hydrolase